jgi:hypothetical protein
MRVALLTITPSNPLAQYLLPISETQSPADLEILVVWGGHFYQEMKQ